MTLAPPAVAPPAVRPPRSVWKLFLLPWVLLAVLGTLWALATPIGGSPDEPAHVVKAASVVRGELLPSEMISTGGVVHVPAAFAAEYQQGCFAFFADTPASCAPPFTGDPSAIVESYSSASLYNPVYYWLVGWPSLVLPDTTGIYAMRIVSAVLCSFFIAACFWMIGSWRTRRVPSLGVLAALTPMAVYLMGTVNPNALEFTAGLALFAGMLGITLHPNPRLLGSRLALVVIASILVSNTRGISALWVAVLLVLPLILLTGRQLLALLKLPAVIVSILLIAIGALASVWWTLSSNSLGTGPSNGPEIVQDVPGVGLSIPEGFLGEIGNFYLRMRQIVGVLGWLDTQLHPFVYVITYVFLGLLALGLALWVRGRMLVFSITLGLAFFFLPPFVQAFFVTKGGFIWQGRYSLILFMALMLGWAACIGASAGFQRWRRSRGLLGAVAVLAGAAWAVSSIYAFAQAMRRFTTGFKNDWSTMTDPGTWTPPLGAWPLLGLFAVVSVAFGAAVVIAGRDARSAVPAVAPPEAAEPLGDVRA